MLKPAETTRERRVAAIVLPELLCEIAESALAPVSSAKDEHPQARALEHSRRTRARNTLLGVVLLGETASEADSLESPTVDPIKPASKLDAVSFEARRFGVRAGQTIAEACA